MYCMYVYVLYMLLVVPFSLDYPIQRWPSLLLIPCSVFTYSRRRHHKDNTLRNFKFSFYKISLSPGIKFTLAESSHKIWRLILLRWIWWKFWNLKYLRVKEKLSVKIFFLFYLWTCNLKKAWSKSKLKLKSRLHCSDINANHCNLAYSLQYQWCILYTQAIDPRRWVKRAI